MQVRGLTAGDWRGQFTQSAPLIRAKLAKLNPAAEAASLQGRGETEAALEVSRP
jgi:hypothetical protein